MHVVWKYLDEFFPEPPFCTLCVRDAVYYMPAYGNVLDEVILEPHFSSLRVPCVSVPGILYENSLARHFQCRHF